MAEKLQTFSIFIRLPNLYNSERWSAEARSNQIGLCVWVTIFEHSYNETHIFVLETYFLIVKSVKKILLTENNIYFVI